MLNYLLSLNKNKLSLSTILTSIIFIRNKIPEKIKKINAIRRNETEHVKKHKNDRFQKEYKELAFKSKLWKFEQKGTWKQFTMPRSLQRKIKEKGFY